MTAVSAKTMADIDAAFAFVSVDIFKFHESAIATRGGASRAEIPPRRWNFTPFGVGFSRLVHGILVVSHAKSHQPFRALDHNRVVGERFKLFNR